MSERPSLTHRRRRCRATHRVGEASRCLLVHPSSARLERLLIRICRQATRSSRKSAGCFAAKTTWTLSSRTAFPVSAQAHTPTTLFSDTSPAARGYFYFRSATFKSDSVTFAVNPAVAISNGKQTGAPCERQTPFGQPIVHSLADRRCGAEQRRHQSRPGAMARASCAELWLTVSPRASSVASRSAKKVLCDWLVFCCFASISMSFVFSALALAEQACTSAASAPTISCATSSTTCAASFVRRHLRVSFFASQQGSNPIATFEKRRSSLAFASSSTVVKPRTSRRATSHRPPTTGASDGL